MRPAVPAKAELDWGAYSSDDGGGGMTVIGTVNWKDLYGISALNGG
jgi:hypothetical protein